MKKMFKYKRSDSIHVYQLILLIAISLIINPLYGNNKVKKSLETVVIDAGHGGKDPGTLGDNNVKEKDITLSIALKLGNLIQQNFPAVRVIYTRQTDDFIELKDRTDIANLNSAKLFISIHVNHKKEDESDKNGFEIYMLDKERLPEAIDITEKHNSILKYQQSPFNETDNFIFSSLAQTGYMQYSEYLGHYFEINLLDLNAITSRGIFQAGFWVLLASMPTVLVETGYISDINDAKYLNSETGQINIAQGLFKGFSRYKILYEMDSN